MEISPCVAPSPAQNWTAAVSWIMLKILLPCFLIACWVLADAPLPGQIIADPEHPSWLWWLNTLSWDGRRWWPDAPEDMFCALGHCGQRGVAILPSQQIVMSWNDAKELHCNRDLGNHVFRLLKESVR